MIELSTRVGTIRVNENDLLNRDASRIMLYAKSGKRYVDSLTYRQREARHISECIVRENISNLIVDPLVEFQWFMEDQKHG